MGKHSSNLVSAIISISMQSEITSFRAVNLFLMELIFRYAIKTFSLQVILSSCNNDLASSPFFTSFLVGLFLVVLIL